MGLLTVQETAKMLKVSPMTIRRYIAAGRLSAVKVGKLVRVREESLEQLMQPIAVNGAERAKPQRRLPRGKPTSADDPLWSIIGIGRSDGPTDVSANKHKYLAEAYETHLRE